MSWVTVIWSMIASACLTLAAIYLLVWYRSRGAWVNLLFSLTAASTTAFAFCELWMMRAESTNEILAAAGWAQVPLFLWLISLTWFVRLYLNAGRRWLAWTVCFTRTLFILPFRPGESLNFREVTSLQHIQFLGEPVAVIDGVTNPWTWVGMSGALMLLVFVADASITAWRRGDRRKALMVGGSIEFFLLGASSTSAMLFWGNSQAPIVFSLLFLGIVAVMGYELSRDVLRASQLVGELQVSEERLRESEARMSLAVEAGDMGIWIWDLKRHQMWASDSWRSLFGFKPSENLDFDSVLQRLHPEDRESVRQAQAIAESNGGKYQIEYRLMLPDETTRWIASRGRVEVDGAGQPVVMRGISREVTARKQAEQQMQLLQREIAHAGRVSMMGQLAAALAHEINQPLAAILRNAEAAELFLQHSSPDLDEVRAILSDIRDDDERAGTVIDRMRGMLKGQTLETRQLDVGTLVRDVVALVRVDAAARRVKLKVNVAGNLRPVRGDRVHLQQVLLNLLLNGMDAVNGPSLEDRHVSVTAQLDGLEIVEIAVRDAGPGIPTDLLAKIFDPFFTTKSHGMGMGLAISRTIIEAHGGRLWAENQKAGGAAFRFTLPIATEAAAK